jgi:hypothetical protein
MSKNSCKKIQKSILCIFQNIPKNFLGRPQAAHPIQAPKITLYDFSATSHTGLFLIGFPKSPAAGRRKKFFGGGSFARIENGYLYFPTRIFGILEGPFRDS